MTDFISSDYVIPEDPSKYLNFKENGQYIFRILGSFGDGTAIEGYEYWVSAIGEDGKPRRKPIRVDMKTKIDTNDLEVNDKTGELEIPKHFWALPVYNQKAKCMQILSITQKTIIKKILEFSRNPKWGQPSGYDIIVDRDDTNTPALMYSVDHDPKEELSDEAKEAYKNFKCDITALYRGEDPFAVKEEKEAEVDLKDINL